MLILTSYIAGGMAEVLFCIVRKEEVTEGFLITGILYPLILPVTMPLWMAAVGIVVGVILGKEVFGGTGKNPFNAALVARCFVYICFPLYMTGGAFVEPLPNTMQVDGWQPHLESYGGLVANRGLLAHNRNAKGQFVGMSAATSPGQKQRIAPDFPSGRATTRKTLSQLHQLRKEDITQIVLGQPQWLNG